MIRLNFIPGRHWNIINNSIHTVHSNTGCQGDTFNQSVTDGTSARVLKIERLDNGKTANVLPHFLVNHPAWLKGNSSRRPPRSTQPPALEGIVGGDTVSGAELSLMAGIRGVPGYIVSSTNGIRDWPYINDRAAMCNFTPCPLKHPVWVKVGIDDTVNMRVPEVIVVGFLDVVAPDSTADVTTEFLEPPQFAETLMQILVLVQQRRARMLKGKRQELRPVDILTPCPYAITQVSQSSFSTFRTPSKTAAVSRKPDQTAIFVTDEPAASSTGANIITTRPQFFPVNNVI